MGTSTDPPGGCGPAEGHEVGLFVAHGGPALGPLSPRTPGNLTEAHTMSRFLPRALMAPAVVTLFAWMIVPLVMTIYFSFIHYNLNQPGEHEWAALENFKYFITDPDFWPSVLQTLELLGWVIVITVVMGIGLALLINEPFPGQGIVRVLLISPFFVMPTVNALLWKHMMMNPIYGVLAQVSRFFGATPVDWLTEHPLFSIIVMITENSG